MVPLTVVGFDSLISNGVTSWMVLGLDNDRRLTPLKRVRLKRRPSSPFAWLSMTRLRLSYSQSQEYKENNRASSFVVPLTVLGRMILRNYLDHGPNLTHRQRIASPHPKLVRRSQCPRETGWLPKTLTTGCQLIRLCSGRE